jgi:cellulose synthase operon protein C
MSDICARVHEFADGELMEEASLSFEWHIAACASCQVELESIMAIRAMALESLGDRRTRRRSRPRWRILSTALPLAAAACLAFVFARGMGQRPAGDGDVGAAFAALADPGERPLTERLAYAATIPHRPPPRVMRRGARPKVASPSALSRLQEQGDQHGVAALLLAAGDRDQAEAVLARLPGSPELENERAVLDMQRDRLAEAEERLQRVMRDRPSLRAAQWNLALVRQRRGDRAGARQAFSAIADGGEPGWAEEARQRVADLGPAGPPPP